MIVCICERYGWFDESKTMNATGSTKLIHSIWNWLNICSTAVDDFAYVSILFDRLCLFLIANFCFINLSLLPLIAVHHQIVVAVHDKSLPASHCHSKRCPIQRSKNNGRFHVLRRGECVTRAAAAYFKNRRNAKNQGLSWDARSRIVNQIGE